MNPLIAIINDLEARLTALEEAMEPEEASDWCDAYFEEKKLREKLEREVSSLESIILEQDQMLHEALADENRMRMYIDAADNEMARLRKENHIKIFPAYTYHTITGP